MSGRTDPEGAYQTRRAANIRKLTQSGVIDELEAEHRTSAWEREAERRGLDRFSEKFWEAGRRWIAEQDKAGWP